MGRSKRASPIGTWLMLFIALLLSAVKASPGAVVIPPHLPRHTEYEVGGGCWG